MPAFEMRGIVVNLEGTISGNNVWRQLNFETMNLVF